MSWRDKLTVGNGRKLLRIWSIGTLLFFPVLLYFYPIHKPPTANRCFAVMAWAIILWMTNIVPVYVTSMLLPLLVILLKLLRGPDGRILEPSEASDRIISVMFTGTILVLLASFVIASSFSQFKLDAINNSKVMRWLHDRPSLLVLTFMAATMTASLFMPCLSAALLSISLAKSQIEGRSRSISKALLMGIVVSGNVGGIISPISSLQSVFAYHLASEQLMVTWYQWMKSSVPVCILITILCWFFICTYYGLKDKEKEIQQQQQQQQRLMDEISSTAATEPNNHSSIHSNIAIVNNNPSQSPPDMFAEPASPPALSCCVPVVPTENPAEEIVQWKVWATIAITLLTVLLWSNTAGIEDVLGSMGISSLVPIVLFYGLRVLPSEAICDLPWDIVLMAMGTLVLNEAAQSSGLIGSIGHTLSVHLEGYSYYFEILLICTSVLITGTLKSHFVAGLIFLPIVMGYIQKTGVENGPEGVAMFLTAAQATSVGIALPVSGLINMAASAIADSSGTRILTVADYLIVGSITSLISLFIIVTIGLGILLYL